MTPTLGFVYCRVAALAFAATLAALGIVATGQQSKTDNVRDHYGLYYADWDDKESFASLVISPDGKPIPPKPSDPDAPTMLGFYVGDQRYPFASARLSAHDLLFKTDGLSGVRFAFRGHFGREDVEDIRNVPYLEGVLVETRSDRIAKKKIRF